MQKQKFNIIQFICCNKEQHEKYIYIYIYHSLLYVYACVLFLMLLEFIYKLGLPAVNS